MYNPPPGLGLPPIIVEDAVAALNGDLGLLKALAQLVLQQFADDLPNLRADVARQDTAALSASSHRLKGSLGAIVALPAYHACSALNTLARVGATDSYAMGLDHLEQEINRLSPFLVGLAHQE